MPFVRVEEVFRTYRKENVEVRALRGISMELLEGDFVAIMGPSGAGKTTFMNILGGIEKATAGQIWIENVEITNLDWKQLVTYRRRVVGHVFQMVNLMPTLSAAENIALPMILNDIPHAERRQRVQYLLEVMQLTHRAGHRPSELSGGEQQRVAIAAALANDPPILLADEPTGELDSETSKTIMDFMAKINHELNKTIIIVTHNPLVAAATKRILRITDGKITGTFTPSELEAVIPVSYIDRLRKRVNQFDAQLKQLETQFKTNQLTSDAFTMERIKLVAAREAFLEEMHRYGSG